MNFKILITKDEDGFYVASVPSLPGCHSQGKTVEDVLDNIKEAITGYLSVAKKYGDPLPKDDSEIIETNVKIPLSVK